MVKAAGGGGGIGMSVARDEEELATAFATAQSRAERFFGNPSILLERYVASARHVEVQILGLSTAGSWRWVNATVRCSAAIRRSPRRHPARC